ncbi:MAG: NAD(P)H-quinone oxidoreductase [Spirochaetaceae bacterium]|nr:NAD(P)H-quinone oxidoreductase [Spirochaetaceae bacterium]MDE0219957.1 NAD(P)H-quinone oxidoreductase [Spirochaetaceae bacterium]
MHAIVVGRAPERSLRWEEVDDPAPPPPGHVLVEVAATAVNRADLLQRAGRYPPPPGAPDILGLEVAGRIAVLGQGVTDWSAGDRVCAIVAGGGYAERCPVPAGSLMRVPERLSLIEAAAVPEAFLTAFVNLFQEAGLRAGESVLVHGGASGVGTSVIQLAVCAGARVAVTARDERKLAVCRRLGAELAIDHTRQDFAAEIEQAWGGVDVVLDIVGAGYLERNLQVLATGGRLVLLATLGGAQATVDLAALMRRRTRIIGSVLRSRSEREKAAITEGFARRFLPLFDEGRLAPIIDRTVPIRQAGEAHALVERFENVGKIVLSVR